MKLIIATPFYNMQGFTPYINSLLGSVRVLNQMKIEWDFWDLNGDSYVDRARNTICAKFLESDATDLLFIDSDMGWSLDGIPRLLKSPYDVTAGIYPKKNKWEDFTGAFDLKEDCTHKYDEKTGLLEAISVPAGFLRIKRECLVLMKEKYPNDTYTDGSADSIARERLYCNFFRCDIVDGYRQGEDYSFCKRWRDIGGKIWIDPNITFSHCGIKEWVGNYKDFFCGINNIPTDLIEHEVTRIQLASKGITNG